MSQGNDVTDEHFGWLVEGRSRNQRSTLELYRLIERREQAISRDLVYHEIAQAMVAIAFSLWRAVFLSDLSGDLGHQLSDIKKFLRNLIAHNSVLYQTDFSSREWTFFYYLDNAALRLDHMRENADCDIPLITDFRRVSGEPKERWSNAQAALDLAIANFAKTLASHEFDASDPARP